MYSTAVFVGDHPLLVACAGRAREAGLEVVAVSTGDASIEAWAQREDIPQVAWSDLGTFLSDKRPDVLLSVGNLRILPDEMVASTKVSINFHDGPLPRFAGLHTPMWALLAGETDYAVTWHVVEGGVDEGDILASQAFEIGPDETTQSMNMKCFAAAGGAFDAVLAQLTAGTLERVPQVGEGQYFGRYDRPVPAGAIVPHTMTAEQIQRLVRALDFGSTINRVGRPLLQVDPSRLLVVQEAAVAPVSGDAGPGTVVSARWADAQQDRAVLNVVTASGAIELTGWLEEGLDPAELVGRQLPDPTPLLADLEKLHGRSSRNEVWWSKRIAAQSPIDVSHLGSDGELTEATVRTGCHSFEDAAASAGAFALAYSGQPAATIELATCHATDPALSPWFSTVVPVNLATPDGAPSCADVVGNVRQSLAEASDRGPFLRDVPVRMPVQREGAISTPPCNVAILRSGVSSDAPVQIVIADDGSACTVRVCGPGNADRLAAGLEAFLAVAVEGTAPFAEAPVIGTAEKARVAELGGAPRAGSFRGPLHQQFLHQAKATPDAVAIVHHGAEVTYAELEERARRVAAALENQGIAPGSFVGVSTDPSPEMLVAVLGVMMAGCAYVPLDPRFPADRLAFMVDDSDMDLILTDGTVELGGELNTLDVSRASLNRSIAPRQLLPDVDAAALAYMMYTSGSTGLPKGVMVRHGNVDSFLQAMEPHVGIDDDGVWLSVTTLSFDISVLELFYPLVHGWKVVLYEGLAAQHHETTAVRGETRLDMSLFFFGSEGIEGGGSYDVLLEVARFADSHGFAAVWTPERHFHAFGGPFPNPSVAGAALAAITEKVGIRSGSCVVPLHHPIRVAEEWAVVDQLSHGRVGLSVAAGWHPNDFVLRPQNYKQPKSAFIDQVNQVRALWRGETVTFEGPAGEVDVVTLPRPVQSELPVWYTTAGNIESFELAGREGLLLLTHLLGQSLDEVAEKVAAYRRAWADAGHPGRGEVALMLHTFVTEDSSIVRETVREPMKGYLRDSIGLVKDHASAFPTFDPTKTEADGALMGLSPEDLDALLEVSFSRYFETSGLFGSVNEAIDFASQVEAIDVDEIAALVDFGIDGQTVIDNLDHLNEVRAAFLAPKVYEPETYGSLIAKHGVTHLQCTPSEARIVLADPASREALGGLRRMLVGGEACPTSVARALHEAVGGELLNVYGPTETTIWSTIHHVRRDDIDAESIPIGVPLDNTAVRVADASGRLRPHRATGELLIGGDGVTAGYHRRPELTAERFLRSVGDEVVYRTGDLVSWRADGTLAFHGRADSQVKVRGHRIELGEIESALETRSDVAEAVVVVEGDGDHAALVAHTIELGERAADADIAAELAQGLPSHMIPERFVWHDRLPTTPNGKVDRLALTKMATGASVESDEPARAPGSVTARAGMNATELAGIIDQAWQDVLGLDKIDRFKSFFDHGGNSLQVVTLRDTLESRLQISVSLVDLFRFGSVNELAEAFAADDEPSAPDEPPEHEPAVSATGSSAERINRRAAARRKARRGQ